MPDSRPRDSRWGLASAGPRRTDSCPDRPRLVSPPFHSSGHGAGSGDRVLRRIVEVGRTVKLAVVSLMAEIGRVGRRTPLWRGRLDCGSYWLPFDVGGKLTR